MNSTVEFPAAIDHFEYLFEGNGIQLEVKITDEGPLAVDADIEDWLVLPIWVAEWPAQTSATTATPTTTTEPKLPAATHATITTTTTSPTTDANGESLPAIEDENEPPDADVQHVLQHAQYAEHVQLVAGKQPHEYELNDQYEHDVHQYDVDVIDEPILAANDATKSNGHDA